MWRIVINLVLLSFVSVSHTAFAAISYYAPERISCSFDEAQRLRCDEFDRRYLTESSTNADLLQSQGHVFHFASAIAYLDGQAANIFYTYTNSQQRMVKLKTTGPSIQPDLKNGQWVKFNDDIYTCDAGYMSCLITDVANQD